MVDRRQVIQMLEGLTSDHLEAVARYIEAISSRIDVDLNPESDVLDLAMAERLGGILSVHHSVSSESFTKDKFEHAMESVLQASKRQAELALRGNAGHDITVDGERWSLKTQADRNIKVDQIHISKFMELGRGRWVDESDLVGLRDRMFEHMKNYERIFTLRCLTPQRTAVRKVYELVEIQKGLLQMSSRFRCQMKHDSRQIPKPGVCIVTEPESHRQLYELYFDGGTERKLQIRKLRKDACVVHATWAFDVT